MEEQHISHLRLGIIIAYNKHARYLIVRMDTKEYPLVFLREWENEPERGYDEYYTLYKAALTAEEADEILGLLRVGEKRKANTLLKRFLREEGVICEFVGAIRLDDAVPDEWYDAWKEVEGLVTSKRIDAGYYELDVIENASF